MPIRREERIPEALYRLFKSAVPVGRGDRFTYRPLNTGWRFSANACAASA